MDPPEHCPDEIYDLMCTCWELEAGQRPSFLSLQQQLARVTQSSCTPSSSPIVPRKLIAAPNGELLWETGSCCFARSCGLDTLHLTSYFNNLDFEFHFQKVCKPNFCHDFWYVGVELQDGCQRAIAKAYKNKSQYCV